MKKYIRKKLFLLFITATLAGGSSVFSYVEQMKVVVKDLVDTSISVDNKEKLDKVVLVKVVDGDTLTVKKNGKKFKVRLLCVNTPESVHSDPSKNNEYGKKASEYTKKVLKDVENLYLEYDEEKTDRYGRTLAYVWLTNSTDELSKNMLNAKLVKAGYATTVVYKPNEKHAETFRKLEKKAKKDKKGLWKYKGFVKLVEG